MGISVKNLDYVFQHTTNVDFRKGFEYYCLKVMRSKFDENYPGFSIVELNEFLKEALDDSIIFWINRSKSSFFVEIYFYTSNYLNGEAPGDWVDSSYFRSDVEKVKNIFLNKFSLFTEKDVVVSNCYKLTSRVNYSTEEATDFFGNKFVIGDTIVAALAVTKNKVQLCECKVEKFNLHSACCKDSDGDTYNVEYDSIIKR